jgi:membrane protease YdiL (CAAX protease family)
VEYLILRPEPLILALRWQEVIVPALILLVATGFVEELAFRGVMQRSAQALGSWGWIYIAVVFSVLQIGHLSALHWLFVLAVALLFGWIVKRTGSILGVSLSHGLINVCLFLIFPFVIS